MPETRPGAVSAPTAVEQPAAVQVLLHAGSPGAVPVQPMAVLVRAGDELGKGWHRVERRRLVHPQLLLDRPARHLYGNIGAGAPPGLVVGQLLPVGPSRSGLGRISQDRRPVDRTPQIELVEPLVVFARGHVDRAPADLGCDPDQGLGLLLRRRHRGNRAAPVSEMEAGPVGGEAQRPPEYGLGDDRSHVRDLVVGGRPLIGVVAHHVQADGGMTDVTAEVDQRAPAADCLEVLGIGLEVPDHTGLEGGDAHVFDLVERAQQRGTILGAGSVRCCSRNSRQRLPSPRANWRVSGPGPRGPGGRNGCGCRGIPG